MRKLVDITKADFAMRMGPGDCYELRTGLCDLNVTADVEYHNNHDMYVAYCGKRGYCKAMAQAISDKKISLDNIVIGRFDCGHYSINDGQHRICVAKRMGIKAISLETYDTLGKCKYCEMIQSKRNITDTWILR